ncbi:MAG: hypothetical protein ACRD2N_08415 [Vicinamibacterales bacterium]
MFSADRTSFAVDGLTVVLAFRNGELRETMLATPRELSVEIRPTARLDIVNVREHATCVGELEAFPRALYWSCHTTAGFLDQRVASHLDTRRGGVVSYLRAFQTMFPRDAGYRHDDLQLRRELSDAQRSVESRNADAHLTFMAAGLRTCVKYLNRPGEPVYFVDLDGIAGGCHRRRLTRVLGFHTEEVVIRDHLQVPMSVHPLDSVSLKDPRIGLYSRLNDVIERHGIAKGRIRLALAAGEDHAALTINENETLLMRHDLVEVLRDPFRFMAEKGRNMIADPWAIPAKAIDYAKYDFVRLFNQVCDVFPFGNTRLQHLVACLVGLQIRRFLRMKRSVNLLVSDLESPGHGRIAEGTYQCPILIQWRKAQANHRMIGITVTRLR